VLQAAAALREAEPSSAAAVRLLRVARWDALAAAPPAQSGATRVAPPPARQRDALAALADPAVLFEQAERAFAAPPAHFWLDLQRLADGALDALGAPYAEARAALRSEAARLLDRLPALLDLRFRDGAPFADAATHAWAAGLSPAPPAHAGGGADAGPSADADPFADARAQAVGGDLAGALDALDAPPPGRAGFVHRLRTAELCLGAGQGDLALALLDALAAEARARDLDAWEPGLAADVYAALGRAARQSGRAEAAADADARLAAVAPARAARLRPA
jgi:type VI secretion system protein VasJ